MADLAAALPEYEFMGELGRGAMGIVVLARHRSLGRPVAIKELPAAFAADESVRSRFLREARTLAALSHPHVVAVYDFVDRQGHLALIMEELPGGTVWDRFTHPGLSPRTACGLMLSTAAGLDHAHRHGVLHRDVKPENLMFTADGQLKVTDFGMAKVMGGEKTLATAESVVVGTPAYMAPEQAEGATVGPPADIYACGTMLYEMLSARLPFASAPTPMAMLVQRITSDPPPLAEVAPEVPAPIAEVVMTALARDVDRRYESVEAFALALGGASARSWGPDWMAGTGVRVTGADAITAAARGETRHGQAPPLERREPSRRHGRREPSRRHGRREPSRRHGRRRAPDTVVGSVGPGDSVEPVESVVPGPADRRERVVVARHPHRQPAIDLGQVSLGQLVDIASLGQGRSPLWPTIVAVALSVALTAAGLVGAEILAESVESEPIGPGAGASLDGQPIAAAPIEIDFSRPFVVSGLGSGSAIRVEASSLGVPLGATEAVLRDGAAEIDPAYLRWTTAGGIDLALVVDEQRRAAVSATATQPWLTTGPTLVTAMAGVFGLATVHSHARGLRSGRVRLGSLLGLIVGGAILGAAVGSLVAIVRGLRLTPSLLVVCAALSAATAVVAGECYRRWRRRRTVLLRPA